MASLESVSATVASPPETSPDDGGDTAALEQPTPAQTPSAMESDDETKSAIMATDEATALAGLTENVRDQDDLERDITNQANQAMIGQEDERDQKRIEKVESNIAKLMAKKRKAKEELDRSGYNTTLRARSLVEMERIGAEIATLKTDIKDIESRIAGRHQYDATENCEGSSSNQRMANESHRDFLIRTGKITPFSRMPAEDLDPLNADLAEAVASTEANTIPPGATDDAEPRSHQHLRLPGFAENTDSGTSTFGDEFGLRPRKKRKLANGSTLRDQAQEDSEEDGFTPDVTDGGQDEDSVEGEVDSDDQPRKSRKRASTKSKVEEQVDMGAIDDGNEKMYAARLGKWVKSRRAARSREMQKSEANEEMLAIQDSEEEEWYKPCPGVPDHAFENDIKMPGDIFPALFDYQKTGVQWLGELYSQEVGGIVGDEMGLGKTIQIISFLAALHYSEKLTKPIIVVAPATVLRQWVNEFHKWWPPMRVSILHSSGSGMMNLRKEGQIEEVDETFGFGRAAPAATKKSSKGVKKIVDRVVEHGHVLVTTYAGLQTYSDVLIPVDWGYSVLDEGHKIRNPNAAITIHCKELRTPHRVILSGTPIQNNLVELWSLFDFVFPMRLGTLVNFRMAFETPIKQGGYANSTNLAVLTAEKCAETLKAAISPYLLQRQKIDVAADLPKKSEQVLFCKLTKPQRDAYEEFLASDEMQSIFNHSRQSLFGIDILRKICNHPDLLNPRLKTQDGFKWGNPNKSGKMQVVKALLQMWKRMGHKTLLFCQGVQMLDVLENYIKRLGGYNYLRMDGSTAIKDRQTLVDRFNNDPDIHVFLLTTKVGGLGVNLTGANRVIIFDPDWNPSTDVQARERAWRLGQKKEVTIYRLMTAGTIEEKIYHRQIFKQFLTNKILKDPKQRQTFQMKDLYDLFTLGSTEDGTTETGEMFKGTEVQFEKTPRAAEPEDRIAVQGSGHALAVQHDVVSQEVGQSSAPQEGDADAEVRNLVGVSSLEAYQGNEEEEKPKSEEERLMQGIFARSGVHSALEHDQIINGKKKLAADRGMLEREAKRVAAEGAAELRRAATQAREVTPGTVTWTGEFGSGGRPQNIRRGGRGGGPSSAAVLGALANRQGLPPPGSANASRAGTPGSSSGGYVAPRTGHRDWAKRIKEYMVAQGGLVPATALVAKFNPICRSPQHVADFKAMLAELCVEERGTSAANARWRLKDEFR